MATFVSQTLERTAAEATEAAAVGAAADTPVEFDSLAARIKCVHCLGAGCVSDWFEGGGWGWGRVMGFGCG